MILSDIKARHAHIENQQRTQSVELLTERRSKSHKDRAWLIGELERALEQNAKLEAELEKLNQSLKELKKPAKKPPVKKKAAKT